MGEQRAKFEASAKVIVPGRAFKQLDMSDLYIDRDVQFLWLGWQASAAESAAEIHRLQLVLAEIGDFAHDKSTGPAVPDALWEVRRMAYDAIRGVV